MRPTDSTTGKTVGVFAAMALCLMALPRTAAADGLHESQNSGPVERCSTGSEFHTGPLVTDDEPTRPYSSCMNASTADHVSFDVCLQGAGAPVSVLPSVFETIRRTNASTALLSDSDDEPSPLLELESNPPRSVPLSEVPTAPHRSSSNSSCTVDRPENCRSLPPGPAQLNLEASPVSPTVRAADFDTPNRPEPDAVSPRSGREIEPSDGYDTPPDRPPRVRSRSG